MHSGVLEPHNTGIKLYCLADAGTGYIVDVYLYTGRRGVLRRHGCGAGNLNARQLMAMWSKQLPVYTVLVGDSFFGSHATAQRLAREGRPFITMVRKDTAGVQQGGNAIQAGQTAVATVDGHKYALQVYKQPKTGGKPPKLVPILSNVQPARGPLHHTGREIHPLVAAYRQLARGGGLCQPDGVADAPLGKADVLVASRARLLAAIRRGQRVCNLPRPRKVPWHG